MFRLLCLAQAMLVFWDPPRAGGGTRALMVSAPVMLALSELAEVRRDTVGLAAGRGESGFPVVSERRLVVPLFMHVRPHRDS